MVYLLGEAAILQVWLLCLQSQLWRALQKDCRLRTFVNAIRAVALLCQGNTNARADAYQNGDMERNGQQLRSSRKLRPKLTVQS
jgi:hypothetical protein